MFTLYSNYYMFIFYLPYTVTIMFIFYLHYTVTIMFIVFCTLHELKHVYLLFALQHNY